MGEIKMSSDLNSVRVPLTIFGLGSLILGGCSEYKTIFKGPESTYHIQQAENDSIEVRLKDLEGGKDFTAGFGAELTIRESEAVIKTVKSKDWQRFLKELHEDRKVTTIDREYANMINLAIDMDLTNESSNLHNLVDRRNKLERLNKIVLSLDVMNTPEGPMHIPNSGVQTGILKYLIGDLAVVSKDVQTIWGKADGGYGWLEVELPSGKSLVVNAGYDIKNIEKGPNYAKVKARNPDGSLEDRTADYATSVMDVKIYGLEPESKFYLGVINSGKIISVDEAATDERGILTYRNVGDGNMLYVITRNKINFNTEENPILAKRPFILRDNQMVYLNPQKQGIKVEKIIGMNDNAFDDSFSYFKKENPEKESYRLLELGNDGWVDQGKVRYKDGEFTVYLSEGGVFAIEQVGIATSRPIVLEGKKAVEF